MFDLDRHKDALTQFARRWHIRELALFGSALRDDFGPESDVDLLVSFEPDAEISLFDLMEMQNELENIFDRDVDLFERTSVEQSPNWIRRRSILHSARPVFQAA